ncbi:MAG TPA: DUF3365 domain-containing protein [Rariglobus sp.]|jgi:hypothetical protein|nr:DUF3365 domain-containing protein [Rariglobus sp.]
MKTIQTIIASLLLTAGVAVFLANVSRAADAASTPSITPKTMADALHAVMNADRTVYTKNVVNRLQNQEHVITASEHYVDDKALPLPAQMFRMGAEMVASKDPGFSYALLSEWPINKQNAPKTDVEIAGLKFVAEKQGKENYYAEETLGDKKYFTAVYADVGSAPACIKCHNSHEDSPRTDFKLGDVMGGVVIRIPVDTK